MNKLREKLVVPFDGLRTETLNELENVCKDVPIAFSVFCAENYSLKFWDNNTNKKWFCTKTGKDLTTEKLFNIFLEQYEK